MSPTTSPVVVAALPRTVAASIWLLMSCWRIGAGLANSFWIVLLSGSGRP